MLGKSNGREFFLGESIKGKRTLFSYGYAYRSDHQGKDLISWRCIRRNCRAQIKTNKIIDTIVFDNGKEHSHSSADSAEMTRHFLRMSCRKKAVEDLTVKSQDIIRSELSRFSQMGCSTSHSNVKYLKTAMYRMRCKARSKTERTDFRKKRQDQARECLSLPNPTSSDQTLRNDHHPPSLAKGLPLPTHPVAPSTISLHPSSDSYFQLNYDDEGHHLLLDKHQKQSQNQFHCQKNGPIPMDSSNSPQTDLSFADSLLDPIVRSSSSLSLSLSEHNQTEHSQNHSSSAHAQNV